MSRQNRNLIGDNSYYQGNPKKDVSVIDGLFDKVFIDTFYNQLRYNTNFCYSRLSNDSYTDRIWPDKVFDDFGYMDVPCYSKGYYKDTRNDPESGEELITSEHLLSNIEGTGACETVQARFPATYIFKQFLEHEGISENDIILRSQVVNAQTRGQDSYPHIDGDYKNMYTLIYYANNYWEKSWGGETSFYDRDAKLVHSVYPKPGRFVLLPSIMPHRGAPPNEQYVDARYTLASVFWFI
jgi:hypothetical protein